MALADPRTDWPLLCDLLRFALRGGWDVRGFGDGRVSVTHRRAARGVAVAPAALMRHAREAGWRAARRPGGFELRHPAVRLRVHVAVMDI